MSDKHLLWRDGHKIVNVGRPKTQTADKLFEELKMKHKPNQCPPIHMGDCVNTINDFLKATRHIVDARTGETAGSTDPQIVAAVSVLTGLQNVAGYLSAAINNGSGDISEALNRLARAIEAYTPTVEPPVLVRLRDVSRRIGISSEGIMRLAKKNDFPQPVFLDDTSGVPWFRESDVNNWLVERAAWDTN